MANQLRERHQGLKKKYRELMVRPGRRRRPLWVPSLCNAALSLQDGDPALPPEKRNQVRPRGSCTAAEVLVKLCSSPGEPGAAVAKFQRAREEAGGGGEGADPAAGGGAGGQQGGRGQATCASFETARSPWFYLQLLRMTITRQRLGDEEVGARHFPAHERADLVLQLERAGLQVGVPGVSRAPTRSPQLRCVAPSSWRRWSTT